MQERKLAFIGSGNMARSLIGGLLQDGHPADLIRASDPDDATRQDLAQRFGITTGASNREAAAWADIVVLAVKPQIIAAVATELADTLQSGRPLVISIAAGIREAALQHWLGAGIAIVRTMPNTPAMVGAGATALHANPHVSAAQRDDAESIMRAAGLTLWLDDEDQMDAVTALSGSGPAYFFLVIEALEEAGRQLGLPAASARLLSLQTAFGAAKMALEADVDSAELRRRVTSPGGTTEQAIGVLEQGGLRELFADALRAAHGRSRELAGTLGDTADGGHRNG